LAAVVDWGVVVAVVVGEVTGLGVNVATVVDGGIDPAVEEALDHESSVDIGEMAVDAIAGAHANVASW